jgi:tetratricopeptide (TPR) repeat protein
MVDNDTLESWEKCRESFLDLALKNPKGSSVERKELLEKMTTRFGSSKRLCSLLLLNLEADGMLKTAFAGYKALGETDSFARKRIVAMHREGGDPKSLQEALCSYLEVFESDEEAWAELSEVYASRQAWSEAIYCSEEVLLARSNDCKCICHHANLLLASGNVDLARKYFCRGAELDVNNIVALRGIKDCIEKSTASSKQLEKWVEEKLRNTEPPQP